MQTRYLTGAHNEAVCAVAAEYQIGLLVQPGNRYDLQVHRYPTWAGDNGAFTTKKGGFDPEKFRAMLRRPALVAAAATCEFVVAPDKLVVLPDGAVVGDAVGTLAQFPAWAEEIRAAGFPVAFVAQNGLEFMLDLVPWALVDVLFIGGSTEWKLSPAAKACVDRAKAEGKRTHMGRVNSYKRMVLAQSWAVDTADGTFLAFGPSKNLPRLLSWLEKLKGSPTCSSISQVPSTAAPTPSASTGAQPQPKSSGQTACSTPCVETTAVAKPATQSRSSSRTRSTFSTARTCLCTLTDLLSGQRWRSITLGRLGAECGLPTYPEPRLPHGSFFTPDASALHSLARSTRFFCSTPEPRAS